MKNEVRPVADLVFMSRYSRGVRTLGANGIHTDNYTKSAFADWLPLHHLPSQ
jgi:hypothetical protein